MGLEWKPNCLLAAERAVFEYSELTQSRLKLVDFFLQPDVSN